MTIYRKRLFAFGMFSGFLIGAFQASGAETLGYFL